MKVIYRTSDKGTTKQKPLYLTKRACLNHFLKIFKGHDIHIVADNVTDSTFEYIQSVHDKEKIYRTSLGNSKTFLYSVDLALSMCKDDDIVYFAEDDYIYTEKAPKVIEEGLAIADYSSGYDHPDKYINWFEGGPNKYIEDGGEATRVLLTQSSHWKLTNSCCMTFATRVNVLKYDLPIYKKFCQESIPDDFGMFIELRDTNYRKLVSPIPAVSTHGETQWLSKFVDWEKCINL